jgi:Arc/MetJ-type ribon-helix-helix transcriptional regulator
MSPVRFHLPADLQAFVDERVNQQAYPTVSENICDLIRFDRHR